MSTRIKNICKYHTRSTKDIVFQGDAFIDAHVVLDLALFAYGYIGADDDVLADVAVLADFGAGEDMGEVPDFGTLADLNVFVGDGGQKGATFSLQGFFP